MQTVLAIPDYLSLRTVARQTGRPIEVLRRWVAADPPLIPARMIDGSWYVKSTDLDLVDRMPRKPWKAKAPEDAP